MAALNRPTEATYEIHERVTVDTSGKSENAYSVKQNLVCKVHFLSRKNVTSEND